MNNFLLLSFEYPPTYPIIRGSIPKLQGDIDDSTPAKNDTPSRMGNIKLFPAEYEEKT